MNTDIFIVTHAVDLEWTRFCLASIHKFANGFKRVIVVVPIQDYSCFDSFESQYPYVRVCVFAQADKPLSHLHHCAVKCSADEFDEESGFFLFIDADCIFRERVCPQDYFVEGKPVLLCESYSSLEQRRAPEVCWREGTAKTLGFMPSHECMRRHPAVHPANTLKQFRAYIESVHKVDFLNYVLLQKPDFPVGFNDFNNLGSFALRFLREHYHWIDLSGHPEHRPRDKLIQYWSHGGTNKPQERWLDGKKETVIPSVEINHVLSKSL